jgi:uncharacterized protein with GYD domain
MENWFEAYYTFEEYDVVIIIDDPNDEAVMSLMLKVRVSWKCENQNIECICCRGSNEDYQRTCITN